MSPTTQPPDVRREVAALVDEWLTAGRFTPSCDSWLRRHDLDFTRALAERGLIGCTWPREVGGRGLPGAARLVVTEELLRHGAPVAAHWIAERQLGPSILRHGTEVARARYLPAIAAGEVTVCLGMSEPGSGSDLASVATRAVRVDGGWSITGQKIWTSQAHRSTHAYVLARTSQEESKHAGLSEFLVDLADPGVTIRAIHDLGGEHHFNEVFLDDVVVDDDHVLGVVGRGWEQVTGQLSLERGGIERVLSTYPLFVAALTAVARQDHPSPGDLRAVGETLARYATLRALALEIALAIDAGGSPVHDAALLKDLGTELEVDVIDVARDLLDVEAVPGGPGPAGLLAQAVTAAPGFTIRGGTTEVLRTIIARGVSSRRPDGDDLARLVEGILDDAQVGGEAPSDPSQAWALVEGLGWSGVGVPEAVGGEGGSLADLVTIVTGLARHHVSIPLAEHVVARRLLAVAGIPLDAGVVTIGVAPRDVRLVDGRLEGRVPRVPWGAWSDHLLLVVDGVVDGEPGAAKVVLVDPAARGATWTPGRNLAGEPRDNLRLEDVPAQVLEVPVETLELELGLLRAAMVHGALERALGHAVEHTRTREQFGRPLIAFQAVGALVATLASDVVASRVGVEWATAAALEPARADAWTRVAAARVVTGRAATRGARVAHQLHAAMGITREHPLHLSTRRLWSWRDEGGTQRSWAERLGTHLTAAGPDAVWRWLTAQDEPAGPDPTEPDPTEPDAAR